MPDIIFNGDATSDGFRLYNVECAAEREACERVGRPRCGIKITETGSWPCSRPPGHRPPHVAGFPPNGHPRGRIRAVWTE